MIQIVPSLLVDSEKEFERRLRLVEHDVNTIHVDVLDGGLFPHTSWYDSRAIGAIRTSVKYELHLMVENPLPIIEEWKQNVPSLIRAIVHAEMHRQTGSVVSHIRDLLQLEAGVALNPETPVEEVHEILHQIDILTIMGVHPGQSGQSFLGDYILNKIRQVKAHRADLHIEVDGGVTLDLVPRLLDAGATHLCAASAIFSSAEPRAKLAELQRTVSTLRA